MLLGTKYSSTVLLRNTVVNFIGLAVPLIAAAICVPQLIAILGNERFAILSITYVLVGYFTLLDLGIGRGLTRLLAQKSTLSPDDAATPAQLIWTGTTVMFAVGAVAGIAFYAITPTLIRYVLRVDRSLVEDCTRALQLLALSLPFVVSSSGWRGVFEAYQRFSFISVVRVLMGVATFAGALIAVKISPTLFTAISVLVAVRIAGWGAQVWVCLDFVPVLKERFTFQSSHVTSLVRAGGWIAVNGLVGSLSMWMDRFLIAVLVSTAAVAYYATPFDVVTKMSLVTGALSNVLFSAFAAQHQSSRARVTDLYRRCVGMTALLLLPICIAIILFARAGLSIWITPAFAEQSYRVAQVITIGTYCLSIQAIPWSLLQGTGKAIVPALLEVIGLAVYLPTIWILTKYYGLEGAAIAWTARSAIATLALFIAAEGQLERDGNARVKGVLATIAVAGLFVFLCLVPLPGTAAIALVSVVCCASVIWLVGSLRRFTSLGSFVPLPGRDLELAK